MFNTGGQKDWTCSILVDKSLSMDTQFNVNVWTFHLHCAANIQKRKTAKDIMLAMFGDDGNINEWDDRFIEAGKDVHLPTAYL